VRLTVSVHPVGPGLLSGWIRHDQESRLAERIAQTERLGNLGWGEWDLITGEVSWSDELYRIYERDPTLGPMPREESEALVLPEDEPVRRLAAAAFGRGDTVDITYRIRLDDRIKHLRAVVDAVRDTAGRPLKIYGIIQDVTAGEVSRARLTEVEERLREQQRSLDAEHRLAAQLQNIVLPIPREPIALPGLEVAVRYLPAEQASRVGGDWYHAAPGRDGTVLIAVGDVAGHGIRAATTMARLRHGLSALAMTTSTHPADLLAHLNELLYTNEIGVITATAVLLRYDPGTGMLDWAQAGHPAPLLTRDGVTRELGRPSGPLLGALRSAGYGSESTRMLAGDLLIVYTDGLIEDRSHSLAEGLAPVVDTLDRLCADGATPSVTDVLAQLRRANPDDDTCVLAARPVPVT
jgi:serine phosphatase RsbU (regulator of sigma subunit)